MRPKRGVEDVADWREERIHVPDETAARQARDEDVRIAEEYDDSPGIDPSPELLCLLSSRQPFQLIAPPAVDRLRHEEDHPERAETCQCGLKPEDVSPACVRDDDTADERSQCRPNKRPREKPAIRSASFYRAVDVADDSTSDNEKACSLERGQHAEDEEAGEIRSQSASGAECCECYGCD